METKPQKDIKFLQYFAIGLGIVGFLILFYFTFILFTQRIINLDIIKLDKFSEFGDFIGGLVGSIWALAGVLLFYVALVYQRKELNEIIRTREDTANALEKQNAAYIKQIEIANSQHFLSLYLPIYEKFEKAVNVLQTTNTFKKYVDFDETYYLTIEGEYNTGFAVIAHKFEQFAKLYPMMFIDGFEMESSINDKIISSIKDPTLNLNFAIYGEKFFLLLKLIDQRFENGQTDDTTKYLLQNLLRERTNEQFLSLIYYSIVGRSTYLTFKYIGRRFVMNRLPEELYVLDEDLSKFILSMVNVYYKGT